MKILRTMVLAAGILSLGGCSLYSSYSEVEALNEAEAIGSPFSQALAAEYREFANRELDEMFDYPDALHFARKGLAAASGETVMPEPVSDWNLSEEHIQELSAARGRLVVAFDIGAREVAPAVAAKAQASFDCWIEQQEEEWSDRDIVDCKQSYLDTMDELEGLVQPPPPPPPPPQEETPMVDASQPMEPEDAMYLVFFNWDSAELGAGALNVLDAIAAESARNPPKQMTVTGHADTSGPKKYNQRLAFRRATNVRDALVERGVDPGLIIVESRGEEELLVPTPDGVREPANRRANISFQ